MSPHCPAIFLQQSRSAGVMAAFGKAQAMTDNATNNAVKARTPTLRISVNRVIVAAAVSLTQREEKGFGVPW
jgi:preprotein translocase subunit SecG